MSPAPDRKGRSDHLPPAELDGEGGEAGVVIPADAVIAADVLADESAGEPGLSGEDEA